MPTNEMLVEVDRLQAIVAHFAHNALGRVEALRIEKAILQAEVERLKVELTKVKPTKIVLDDEVERIKLRDLVETACGFAEELQCCTWPQDLRDSATRWLRDYRRAVGGVISLWNRDRTER